MLDERENNEASEKDDGERPADKKQVECSRSRWATKHDEQNENDVAAERVKKSVQALAHVENHAAPECENEYPNDSATDGRTIAFAKSLRGSRCGCGLAFVHGRCARTPIESMQVSLVSYSEAWKKNALQILPAIWHSTRG